jgi:hypothetical protein
MVIEYDISPQFVPIPPDEAEQEIHDLVEEELSFVYKKGKPGYRVEIAEAKHMTFSDLVILQAWADAGRCFGTEDPLDAARTLEVMRDYVREFFDKFLPGRPQLASGSTHQEIRYFNPSVHSFSLRVICRQAVHLMSILHCL